MKVTIEAISNRYRTVLVNKKWHGVAEDVDLAKIKAKKEYEVIFDGETITAIEPIKGVDDETMVWVKKDWRISRLAAIERAILFLEKHDKNKENFTLEEVFEVAEKMVDFAYDQTRMKP